VRVILELALLWRLGFIASACIRAGLFVLLRHTFSSILLLDGVALLIVQWISFENFLVDCPGGRRKFGVFAGLP